MHFPAHPLFEKLRNDLNRAAKEGGVPDAIKNALPQANLNLYVDYKAVLCMVVMSWIMRAAIVTCTSVEYSLIELYTHTVSILCLARLAGVTAEQLQAEQHDKLLRACEKLVGLVKHVFGDRLPPDLPLPGDSDATPWLSPAMWHAVE